MLFEPAASCLIHRGTLRASCYGYVVVTYYCVTYADVVSVSSGQEGGRERAPRRLGAAGPAGRRRAHGLRRAWLRGDLGGGDRGARRHLQADRLRALRRQGR